MQSLYEWDFSGRDDTKLPEIVANNLEEFGPGLEDPSFVRELIEGIMKHRTAIDDIIVKAAPEWPLEQIQLVDRNVLRLGIYELLYGNWEGVPPKVAINEAIELAKNFGGENSGRFVNGVLGTIYREMGEPMKEHQKKEAVKPEEAQTGAVPDASSEEVQANTSEGADESGTT